MPLEITEADLADRDDAAAVLELLGSYAADPMGGNAALSADVQANLIPRLSKVDFRLVLLARVDGQPAGLAIAFRVFSTFKAAAVLNLHDFAVHPMYQGQGVGRELLKQVEAHARRLDCCRVSLEVRVDNVKAQNLYRSEGFGPGDPLQEFWIKPLT
jgi:ribosomal protein S18 acetylase RimI-like enzyme